MELKDAFSNSEMTFKKKIIDGASSHSPNVSYLDTEQLYDAFAICPFYIILNMEI